MYLFTTVFTLEEPISAK